MKIIINPSNSGNVIATVAIGDQYLSNFNNYASYSWRQYCNKYDLGLIVFDRDLIDPKAQNWKKPNWQKLLIGKVLSESGIYINNVCHLDTDILISPVAPNVFDYHEDEKISVVSQLKNLPYPQTEILRRIAFFRNKFYSNEYPLDSALFANLDQIFSFHGIETQKDYFCTGVYIFNIKNHAKLMYDWFHKYASNVETLTGGGEEPHLNFEIQQYGNFKVLDYKFQALWNYEMAWKYPFLYHYGRHDKRLIRECIETSLYSNYFLHFAGSWYESEMWKISEIFASNETKKIYLEYSEYLKTPVTGRPKGIIRP